MGTTADGGRESEGGAVSGDRPIGAARCRREQHTKGVMPKSPFKWGWGGKGGGGGGYWAGQAQGKGG